MSRFYGGWAAYVPVAERRRRAARAMEKRRKAGHPVSPVMITGRAIATTFWGRAWCDAIEGFRDYESRLPRGRTYVRNGSVVDLQIMPGRIAAVVSGSELYDVAITITEAPQAQWRRICADCGGGIDSVVELLQGRFSKAVMERLCRQQGGLFPCAAEIRFSCSCPDHALMCKHVAAVLYGVGTRLDRQPELLFRLRGVDEADLVARIDAGIPLSMRPPAAGRVLEADDVAALFGLDMAAPEEPAAAPPGCGRGRRGKGTTDLAAAEPPSRPPAAGKKTATPASKSAGESSALLVVKRAEQGRKASVASGDMPRKSDQKKVPPAKGPSRPASSAKQASAAQAGRVRTTPASASGRTVTPGTAGGRTGTSAAVRKAPPRAPAKQATKTREAKPKPVKWW